LTQDPEGAADRFAREYARRGPVLSKERPPAETPPADLDETGLRNWHNDKAAHAYREAQALVTDRSEFDATAHQRAKLQELFPGRKFSEIVHSLNSIDPTHVAQKVVRMFGAPISQFERAERHQAAEYQQQQHTAATQWIGQVVQSGALPGSRAA
jgi:hypothetical protein